MNELPKLELPDSLNYIGAFMTMGCNLACSYCINVPEQTGDRDKIFPIQTKKTHTGLTPEEWVRAFNRIPNREDLPITLQGGEPSIYWAGKGIGEIFKGTDHYFDLLTNMASLPFYKTLAGQQHKLKRKAPYPSIRVSWHEEEMNRVWKGDGFVELVKRCEALKDYGFTVSPDKTVSDVGIYMVSHPSNKVPDGAFSNGRVPFETKEFLGVYEGELYGTYAYPHSTDLISRNIHHTTLSCECRTTELLIDPMGFIHNCHYHLYSNWECGGPVREFEALKQDNFNYDPLTFCGSSYPPIGHILDPKFSLEELKEFNVCYDYGKCIGCDSKLKNNRHQSLYDSGVAHSSVEIKNIQWPESLK